MYKAERNDFLKTFIDCMDHTHKSYLSAAFTVPTLSILRTQQEKKIKAVKRYNILQL